MKTFTASRFHDPRGTLSAVENFPFPVKRIYYLYDIPAGETQRGGHAHIQCHRLIFALSGSFDVVVENDSKTQEEMRLMLPWLGIEVPPLTWLQLKNFSSGAVCLVLASTVYDENDYLRTKEDWLKYCIAAELMEKP